MTCKRGIFIGFASLLTILSLQAVDPSASALQAALDKGGLIQFSGSGPIVLSTNLNVTRNAIIDGVGHEILLDGGGQTRLFFVHTNVNLTLRHLVLTNGQASGELYDVATPKLSARGGAIYNDGGAVEIDDCQFTHNVAYGRSNASNLFAYGGDIYNGGGQIRITNSTFRASTALGHASIVFPADQWAWGGSIYSFGGGVVICSSIFDGCVARVMDTDYPSAGGAIASSGSNIQISDTQFLNNSCGSMPGNNANGPGLGGAIYNGGLLTVQRCQFTTNFISGTVLQGAAIYNANSGTIACTNSYFGQHNVARPPVRLSFSGADQLGGAVLNDGAATFVGCVFEGNGAFGSISQNGRPPTSGFGGAIYTRNALTVLDCSFYRNQAAGGSSLNGGTAPVGSGGAIYAAQGTAAIQFSTFFENYVTGGVVIQSAVTNAGPAAGGAVAAGTNATVTIQANIFANRQSTTNFSQLSGGISDLGFNLSSDASPALTAATSLYSTDPRLGSFGFYGGPTPCFPLLPGSPAIDAGPTKDGSPVRNITHFDQRGAPRSIGKAPDIGSFEVSPNGKLVLAGGSPRYSLFFPFDTNRTWTIQTSTNLIIWEALNNADTNQPGFISVEVNYPAGARFFRAIGK